MGAPAVDGEAVHGIIRHAPLGKAAIGVHEAARGLFGDIGGGGDDARTDGRQIPVGKALSDFVPARSAITQALPSPARAPPWPRA